VHPVRGARIGCRVSHGRLAGAALGAAGDHRRTFVGRADVRANCPSGRLLVEHGPSPIPGRAFGVARKIGEAMSESTSDPKLAALEKSLTALVPVPGRIDRDQLLFRAGQASVRTRPWLWPTSTALLAVVASVLGTALIMRPAPAPVDRIVYVPVPQPAGMSPAPASSAVVSTMSPGVLSSIGYA